MAAQACQERAHIFSYDIASSCPCNESMKITLLPRPWVVSACRFTATMRRLQDGGAPSVVDRGRKLTSLASSCSLRLYTLASTPTLEHLPLCPYCAKARRPPKGRGGINRLDRSDGCPLPKVASLWLAMLVSARLGSPQEGVGRIGCHFSTCGSPRWSCFLVSIAGDVQRAACSVQRASG